MSVPWHADLQFLALHAMPGSQSKCNMFSLYVNLSVKRDMEGKEGLIGNDNDQEDEQEEG